MISAGGIFSNRADAIVRATLSIRISGDCKCNQKYNGEDCSFIECPNQCSFNGKCNKSGTCTCDPGFSGDDCSTQQCINNCNSDKGQGSCDNNKLCICVNRFQDGLTLLDERLKQLTTFIVKISDMNYQLFTIW